MSASCIKNCLACGRCANFPILDEFRLLVKAHEPRVGYGIAIDIGTTTVVLALLDLERGNIVARHSMINPQRVFGPDIISRIDAANKGHLDEQCRMIRDCIAEGINKLLAYKSILHKSNIPMSIAGNTTMMYLLFGFSCESLGVSPFKPKYSLADRCASDLFEIGQSDNNIYIFPWLAAFVGGDITSGLMYVLSEGKERFLLIDLGTNGEMALYESGRLIVTSTAAGPAFEQPSDNHLVHGASDTVSGLAQLIRNGVLDRAGKLNADAAVNFTQKQIRELQLAKSAVRSGLEILIETARFSYSDLDAVYLAGGIGQAMVVNDAIEIGLIPRELGDKTHAAGNAALGGAVHALLAPAHAAAGIENILTNVSEINLALHINFNNYFIKYMFFDRNI